MKVEAQRQIRGSCIPERPRFADVSMKVGCENSRAPSLPLLDVGAMARDRVRSRDRFLAGPLDGLERFSLIRGRGSPRQFIALKVVQQCLELVSRDGKHASEVISEEDIELGSRD